MQDDQQQEGQQINQQQAPQGQQTQPHKGILDQTFGDVLQNKEAQEKIMKSMHLSPEQFQSLLKSTENNPLTHMTMGQLFKSGFVQKAVNQYGDGQKVAVPGQVVQQPEGQPVQMVQGEIETSKDEVEQMAEVENAQVLERDEMGNPTKVAVPVQQQEQQPQKSLWDTIKGLFK